MKCPNCGKRPWHTIVNTTAMWCPTCGTLKTPAGSILCPTLATLAVKKHGLLTVAADAVQRANRAIGEWERNGRPRTDCMWAITEALGAIIHELDAREDEREPTAAERHDERQAIHDRAVQSVGSLVAKAIQDGVDAVHRERERCAKLAEGAAGFGVGNELARKIREVPT